MTARRRWLAGLFVLAFCGTAGAQWYDTTEIPGGIGDILRPFSLQGYNPGSGGEMSAWIAPGTDPKLTQLSFLLRGGYQFSSKPVYLGLEVPMALFSSDAFSQFVIGDVGLSLKYRLDPTKKELEFYTGWTLNVYLPTAQISDTATTAAKQMQAQTGGLMSSLIPGLHQPEAVGIVGSFDILLPGKLFYFQFELSPAIYIPVSDTGTRDTWGAFIWGGLAGWNIIEQLALVVEFKGYTPLNDELFEQSLLAFSAGLRMRFGAFQPALWVSLPLNYDYRQSFPDAIVGINLGAWF
ncbi:MAG: hypothetical protein D6806_06080 [Deltaproteobacteria bacterium]|nr:MAG: hypothetical protein D6806_06080 [Deltaproteobacteria bacterium]